MALLFRIIILSCHFFEIYVFVLFELPNFVVPTTGKCIADGFNLKEKLYFDTLQSLKFSWAIVNYLNLCLFFFFS